MGILKESRNKDRKVKVKKSVTFKDIETINIKSLPQKDQNGRYTIAGLFFLKKNGYINLYEAAIINKNNRMF
jgi:hypothetical protein